MPIDVHSEEILSFAAAARLPCFQHRRNGRAISVSCLWRWATSGVKGVVLETLVIGGHRVTSREAIARFIAATTAAAEVRAGRTPSDATLSADCSADEACLREAN